MLKLNLISAKDESRIVDAIRLAELNCSGEVRVHIEANCKDDAKARAIQLFEKLGMTKTKLRNGILIYVATNDHKFAIIGDQGINDLVGHDFWDDVKEKMLDHLKQGQIADAVCLAVTMAGEKLKIHFPFERNDKDELSNEISFGS